jgi:hypothetical protein
MINTLNKKISSKINEFKGSELHTENVLRGSAYDALIDVTEEACKICVEELFINEYRLCEKNSIFYDSFSNTPHNDKIVFEFSVSIHFHFRINLELNFIDQSISLNNIDQNLKDIWQYRIPYLECKGFINSIKLM